MSLSSQGATVPKARRPSVGNGLQPVHGPEQGSADGRVGVGVPTSHDGIDHGFLQVRSMEQLPESVMEGNENPAFMTGVLRWRSTGGRTNDVKNRSIDVPLPGPLRDPMVDFHGAAGRTDRMGNRHGEQGVCLPADRVRMGEGRILPGPLRHLRQGVAGTDVCTGSVAPCPGIEERCRRPGLPAVQEILGMHVSDRGIATGNSHQPRLEVPIPEQSRDWSRKRSDPHPKTPE